MSGTDGWQQLRDTFLASCDVARTYSSKWRTVFLRLNAGMSAALLDTALFEYVCTLAGTGEAAPVVEYALLPRPDGVLDFSADCTKCNGPLRIALSHAGHVLGEWTLQPCFEQTTTGAAMAEDSNFCGWEGLSSMAVGASDEYWYAFTTSAGVAIVNGDYAAPDMISTHPKYYDAFVLERFIAQHAGMEPNLVLRTPADTLLISYSGKTVLHEYSCKGTLLGTTELDACVDAMALRNNVLVLLTENKPGEAHATATVFAISVGTACKQGQFNVPLTADPGDWLEESRSSGFDHELRSVCVMADGSHIAFAEYIGEPSEYWDVVVTVTKLNGEVVRTARLRDPVHPHFFAEEQPWQFASGITCTDNNELVIAASAYGKDSHAYVYSAHGDLLTCWKFDEEETRDRFPIVFFDNSLFSASYGERELYVVSTSSV